MDHPYMHQHDLSTLFNAFLNDSLAKDHIGNDDEDDETMQQVTELHEGIEQAHDEQEVVNNLEAIFNVSCDMVTVAKYIRKKCSRIESQFSNYAALYDIFNSDTVDIINNDDKETFGQIRYGLIQCYTVALNMIEYKIQNPTEKESFAVQLTSLNTVDHFDYDEDGAYKLKVVNSFISLNNYASLLGAITIFFLFYEALLRIAHDRTPDTARLRSIMYSVKAMTGDGKTFKSNSFYRYTKQLYIFLRISDKSILISYVSRAMKLSIAGDCSIERTSAPSQSFMCARGTLMAVGEYHYGLDRFRYGLNAKAVLIIESDASFTPLSKSPAFLDKIYKEKTLVVISVHGTPTFDARLFSQALTSSPPNLPTFTLFDGDLKGLEMAESVKVGMPYQSSLLSRATCIVKAIKIGILPFQLSNIPMTPISTQDENDFMEKLRKFKNVVTQFDFHRDFHENVALHLIFGFTASANDTPVTILIELIDRLLAQFNEKLCLTLSAGLIYFEFVNELAFFWCSWYQWEQVDLLKIDAIIKYKIFPSIFIHRFIDLLNETAQAKSKKIKMLSMAFNSPLNTDYVFSGAIDIQLIQIDVENYICVYADEDNVDVCGFYPRDLYNKSGIHELLEKRYHGFEISEYKEYPSSCCPCYVSGVYFCHFVISIVMDHSPSLNQLIDSNDILIWFKKIVMGQNSMGPYLQNIQH